MIRLILNQAAPDRAVNWDAFAFLMAPNKARLFSFADTVIKYCLLGVVVQIARAGDYVVYRVSTGEGYGDWFFMAQPDPCVASRYLQFATTESKRVKLKALMWQGCVALTPQADLVAQVKRIKVNPWDLE